MKVSKIGELALNLQTKCQTAEYFILLPMVELFVTSLNSFLNGHHTLT